jgi:RNA ligase
MLETLERYHEEGLLHKQTHPTLDLTIWNYSPKVQYEKLWDDITMQCRGLITNSRGEIVARPFKKFFNYEEHSPEEIPNESFEVFEKMDGSLGIIFYYERKLTGEEMWDLLKQKIGEERFKTLVDELVPFSGGLSEELEYHDIPRSIGEWHIATRGSFISDQSIKGSELLKGYNTKYGLIPGYTYCVEIIYPENRIVVDYQGVEKLVVLGVIHTESGVEGSIENMESEGWEIVKKYNTFGDDWETLKGKIDPDREGYVIRFRNGMRMKIKGEEYCRLHKILTNISNRDIWEHLKNNEPLDEILEKVPDEFYDWVKNEVDKFQEMYMITVSMAELTFIKHIKSDMSRKEAAEIIKTKDSSIQPILFRMLDNKDYSDLIWKKLYPSYSKPFKKNNEQN